MAAKKKTGPSTLRGSVRARAVTVVVLEALSGEVGTTEAAERLGVSLSRYYQLEAKALGGMLKALEPRTKGPQMTPEREIQALQAEKRALEKELRRQQTLLRAARRSVGLPARGRKAASSARPNTWVPSARGKRISLFSTTPTRVRSMIFSSSMIVRKGILILVILVGFKKDGNYQVFGSSQVS